MEIYPVETGKFKLDGGAMFGVVPKAIWQRTNPADDKNRIDMAMRSLLLTEGNRIILVDTGIGNKYDKKFASIYDIDHESQNLDKSLRKIGITKNDITDVILTHLHFDHCGGTTEYDKNGNLRIAFPNAQIWVQKKHLDWALKPNAREKASFLKENILPLVESEQLKIVEGETEVLPGVSLKVVNGHTEAQQLVYIENKGKKYLYAADLFPTYGHIPLPYVMSYDTRPLLTLEERAFWLEKIVQEEIILIYEHDPYNEAGKVLKNERGKYKSGETFPLHEVL